jgi:tripartite-type tricarboxylate transporter receptor subunit TctC
MRLIVFLLIGLIGTAFPLRHADAIDYPTRTVRVIIPFTAGGAPDVLLRVVAQKLSEKWGQSVIVENRVGGNNA